MSSNRLKSRLWEWRLANEMTLKEMSDLSGLSESFLSRLERGQRRAEPQTKRVLARRLGVDIADLFQVEPLDETEEVTP